MFWLGYIQMIHIKTIDELIQEQKLIKERIQNIGPVIEGSIARNGWHCKNKNCKCSTKGELNRSTILCRRADGKSYARHIPKAIHQDVRQWIENRKKLKALIKEMATLPGESFYLLFPSLVDMA